jgi:hypothetical protein
MIPLNVEKRIWPRQASLLDKLTYDTNSVSNRHLAR